MSENKKEMSAIDAMFEAQKIAFAPIFFQAVVTMRQTGIFAAINKKRKGITVAEIVKETNVSEYGVRVLLEAAESLNAVEYIDDNTVKLTMLGYMLSNDEMTGININFTNDVCYDEIGRAHV